MNGLEKALKVIAKSGLSTEEVLVKMDELKKFGATNYEIKEGDTYYYIDDYGQICKYDAVGDELENFNAFPYHKRKLVEYIAKKQKLERALLIYSDLHGAYKMDWKDGHKSKYYIEAKLDTQTFTTNIDVKLISNHLGNIYFFSEDVAKKTIKLYKDEIKEVLRLQRELYKDDSKTRK